MLGQEIKSGDYFKKHDEEDLKRWKELPKKMKKIYIEYVTILETGDDAKVEQFILKTNFEDFKKIDLTIIPSWIVDDVAKGNGIDISFL